jgi:predicted nucleic acid-binding protein
MRSPSSAAAIALDTNAYSAFKRGTPEAVEVVRRTPAIVLPAIVLGELRSGFALGARAATNEAELLRFLASPRVSVQPVDESASFIYATLVKQLRRQGTPIPTNDLWIAACAMAANAALLTYDAHFSGIDGLMLYLPYATPEDPQ